MASQMNVSAEYLMSNARFTFVAPMFPLPTFLTSTPLILHIIKPKGIDPIKYAKRRNNIFIIV